MMKSKSRLIETSSATRNLKPLWKRILLASQLPVWLALLPHPVLGHNPVGGSATTANVVLDDFPAYSIIRSVGVTVPAAGPTHRCEATASADVINPNGNGADQEYDFVLSLDNSNPAAAGASLRTIEVRDQGGVNDPNRWPVATNLNFSLGAGGHTIFFLGREQVAANPNVTIDNSALSVSCSHDALP